MGSTLECILEPRLHTSPVAGSRWHVELQVMRDEEYLVLAGRWAPGSGWRFAALVSHPELGETSQVSFWWEILSVLFSNVENDVITRPSGEEGQVNRGLNEEWRCNYGWTAEGDVKSSWHCSSNMYNTSVFGYRLLVYEWQSCSSGWNNRIL